MACALVKMKQLEDFDNGLSRVTHLWVDVGIRSDLGSLKGFLIRPDWQLPLPLGYGKAVDYFLIISLKSQSKCLPKKIAD